MAPLPVAVSSTLQALSALTKRSATHIASLHPLAKRDIVPRQMVAIPATYTNQNGTPPGQVVGITLGSVAGFILLIWLIYTLAGPKNAAVVDDATIISDQTESVVQRRKSRASSRRRSEMRQREYMEPPHVVGVERTIVEETRVRDGSRIPPPPRSHRSGRSRSPSVDEVVVIEDNSPPRRSSRSKRRSSGQYRSVDPGLYAGGDMPMRSVSRRR
jgi:hypothetical protein